VGVASCGDEEREFRVIVGYRWVGTWYPTTAQADMDICTTHDHYGTVVLLHVQVLEVW
jgi:hypothetical protein